MRVQVRLAYMASDPNEPEQAKRFADTVRARFSEEFRGIPLTVTIDALDEDDEEEGEEEGFDVIVIGAGNDAANDREAERIGGLIENWIEEASIEDDTAGGD